MPPHPTERPPAETKDQTMKLAETGLEPLSSGLNPNHDPA